VTGVAGTVTVTVTGWHSVDQDTVTVLVMVAGGAVGTYYGGDREARDTAVDAAYAVLIRKLNDAKDLLLSSSDVEQCRAVAGLIADLSGAMLALQRLGS